MNEPVEELGDNGYPLCTLCREEIDLKWDREPYCWLGGPVCDDCFVNKAEESDKIIQQLLTAMEDLLDLEGFLPEGNKRIEVRLAAANEAINNARKLNG